MQAPLRPPPVLTMAVALAASWASMLAHNMYEPPLAPIDVENSGPLLLDVLLLAGYWRFGQARVVQVAILGWALLNLVIGGVLSVFPLPIWPWVPEQSVSHYLAHVVYALGQLPVIGVAVAAVRARRGMAPAA